MALLRLPDELLALIVSHAIPEGFESLCLACRRLHTLCKPLIKQHNVLRSQFRDFNYYEKVQDPSFTIRTSFELIARIAEEPVVARYIQHADFEMDLRLPVGGRLWLMEDSGYRPDTVRDLFASSRYLSGADWEGYFARYERDLADNRYCQASAAFLLTLLPNVKSVVLPQSWTCDEDTEKLLEAIVDHARQSNTTSTNASLSRLVSLKTSFSLVTQQGFVLNKITPLLALPRIRSFHGPSSVSHIGARNSSSPYPSLPPSVGETLESAHLLSSNLDGPAMEHFLRCTPRLKTLVYSHSSKQFSAPWDICALVTTIVKEAGSHLEELSITTRDFTGKIAFGTTTMRDFARLHKLEIPLDLATCVLRSAAQLETKESIGKDFVAGADQSHVNLLMCGLVPASVTRLFLRSDEWKRRNDVHDAIGFMETDDGVSGFKGRPQEHERTLETMFQGFAEKKDAQLPSLKEIRVSYPATAGEVYKARCKSLLPEAEKVGVAVHLDGGRYPDVLDFAGL
ncbi:hypothetical protein DM02DRAFT_615812 [Periconia macrospinosa]|uniref:F-box domain-containing protein n=1 Tax=Periconia macrospinosa TaxID=97972 RepID=A0A2V1DJV2_9PLEO|nr:hypothetical protein DM02DRAFT_615812 [Periconia macrospinosa]